MRWGLTPVERGEDMVGPRVPSSVDNKHAFLASRTCDSAARRAVSGFTGEVARCTDAVKAQQGSGDLGT